MIGKKLYVEITRKCNLKCAHCLRGASQDIHLTPENLRESKFLVQKHVEVLHLTGGEPLIDGCRHLLSVLLILKDHIKGDRFELITNLTEKLTDDFFTSINILKEMHNKGIIWYSNDSYHKKARVDAGVSFQYKNNLKRLKKIFTSERGVKLKERKHINMCAPGIGIICAGRAKKLGLKKYYRPRGKDPYLTAWGKFVYGGNNMSFQQADASIQKKWEEYVAAEFDHYFGDA